MGEYAIESLVPACEHVPALDSLAEWMASNPARLARGIAVHGYLRTLSKLGSMMVSEEEGMMGLQWVSINSFPRPME